MYDIIDLTLQALDRMNIMPENSEDEAIFFYYNEWPCFCQKCSPFTIKIMVYLYTSDIDFSWRDDEFRLAVCDSISKYDDSYDNYLHEDEGMLFLVTHITPPYSESPTLMIEQWLTNFFDVSVPRAKKYIEGIPKLRDALGRHTHWGWTIPQEEINKNENWTVFSQYSEGMVVVIDEYGRYGFLDAGAKIAIPCKWANARSFSEGLAAVKSFDGRYGFINHEGRVIIPCEWHDAQGFSEGLAPVMSASGKWGFINTDARLVIPCKWRDVDDFNDGQARVWDRDGCSFFIDRDGLVANR